MVLRRNAVALVLALLGSLGLLMWVQVDAQAHKLTMPKQNARYQVGGVPSNRLMLISETDLVYSWELSQVHKKYRGFTAMVRIYNNSKSVQTVTCRDPHLRDLSEYRLKIYHHSKYLSTMRAWKTLCTVRPNGSWDIGPNGALLSWTKFRGVPMKGTRASLDWPIGIPTHPVNPYRKRID
jgi:hypothetical protein